MLMFYRVSIDQGNRSNTHQRNLRDLGYCGWQTLTSSLRRLERYQHRQFLTSTFANLMGDDYREFERDLDAIPSHLKTIMLAIFCAICWMIVRRSLSRSSFWQ